MVILIGGWEYSRNWHVYMVLNFWSHLQPIMSVHLVQSFPPFPCHVLQLNMDNFFGKDLIMTTTQWISMLKFYYGSSCNIYVYIYIYKSHIFRYQFLFKPYLLTPLSHFLIPLFKNLNLIINKKDIYLKKVRTSHYK